MNMQVNLFVCVIGEVYVIGILSLYVYYHLYTMY